MPNATSSPPAPPPSAAAAEPAYARVLLRVLPIATPLVAALGLRLDLVPWITSVPLQWAGVAAVALGIALQVAARQQLGPRFSPRLELQPGHTLETRGLYARTRHPGYLGALLACAGAMVMFGSGLALPLVASFAGLLRARIAREETLLEQRFGEAFVEYRRRSGSMMPRLWPAPRR